MLMCVKILLVPVDILDKALAIENLFLHPSKIHSEFEEEKNKMSVCSFILTRKKCETDFSVE